MIAATLFYSFPLLGESTGHKYTNTNTQTHKHTNTQTHKHTNTQIHKYTMSNGKISVEEKELRNRKLKPFKTV